MDFTYLPLNKKYRQLVDENKRNFEIFCYKCFKTVGEDMTSIDIKNNIDDQLRIIIAAKYFFML